MELVTGINIRRTAASRIGEVNFDKLEFGAHPSDHMLVCDYYDGAWHAPQIMPFANLSLSPAALALHYGQTVFEGMKAFRMSDGRINIFRIERHHERLVKSLERMCMAVVPKDIFIEGLTTLVDIDRAWVPPAGNCALYLRPFVIATESRFGIKVSDTYRFIIFTGPVPKVYPEPIKVKVETNYIRAARGGTGFAKCGGNYGGAFYPTQLARNEGYDQVLWTDADQHNYLEESGMMNIMVVIGNTLITPSLSDSILDGITRESLLILAEHLGYPVEVRPIGLEELRDAFVRGTIREAFGAGTAAVVAPIKTIGIDGTDYHLPKYSHENISYKLKQQLEGIRTGQAEDIFGWNYIL